jgi:hypothetical protein
MSPIQLSESEVCVYILEYIEDELTEDDLRVYIKHANKMVQRFIQYYNKALIQVYPKEPVICPNSWQINIEDINDYRPWGKKEDLVIYKLENGFPVLPSLRTVEDVYSESDFD